MSLFSAITAPMTAGMSSIGGLLGSITGATQAADAAKSAAGLQSRQAQAGIEEQRRQFDALVAAMSPYTQAGTGALEQYQNILGLRGANPQQQAISAYNQNPYYQAMAQQSADTLLQNAAATGGLRGGNTQAALAQLQPQIMGQYLNQLGGLASAGQSAAALQGQSGMGMASNIGNLLAQQGAAQAGGIMAQGGLQGRMFGDLLKVGGIAAGLM